MVLISMFEVRGIVWRTVAVSELKFSKHSWTVCFGSRQVLESGPPAEEGTTFRASLSNMVATSHMQLHKLITINKIENSVSGSH